MCLGVPYRMWRGHKVGIPAMAPHVGTMPWESLFGKALSLLRLPSQQKSWICVHVVCMCEWMVVYLLL